MTIMIKVYIASPYTIGDKEKNTQRQIDAWEILTQCGFAPFAPLLTHYIEKHYKHDYDTWLKIDFAYLSCCDALLRLDGESKGADMEVDFAIKNDIPVFYNYADLQLYFMGANI